MTREEAIERFNGIINAMSISVAQSKFYPSKAELDELCDMAIEALTLQNLTEPNNTCEVDLLCKDCKWHKLTDNNETEVCTNKQWDISMAVYPIISADDFCSYGERREPDKCE